MVFGVPITQHIVVDGFLRWEILALASMQMLTGLILVVGAAYLLWRDRRK